MRFVGCLVQTKKSLFNLFFKWHVHHSIRPEHGYAEIFATVRINLRTQGIE